MKQNVINPLSQELTSWLRFIKLTKNKLILLLVCFSVSVNAEVLSRVPDDVLYHKMDMESPLPEPSFNVDTTVLRVHFLNYNPSMVARNRVFLSVTRIMPLLGPEYSDSIDSEGNAEFRFVQYGICQAVLNAGKALSKAFYLDPGETADVYVDYHEMCLAYQAHVRFEDRDRRLVTFSARDKLTEKQIHRELYGVEYPYYSHPHLWFKGRYADLNTVLHRYFPWDESYGWDEHYENQLLCNIPYRTRYIDDLILWYYDLRK